MFQSIYREFVFHIRVIFKFCMAYSTCKIVQTSYKGCLSTGYMQCSIYQIVMPGMNFLCLKTIGFTENITCNGWVSYFLHLVKYSQLMIHFSPNLVFVRMNEYLYQYFKIDDSYHITGLSYYFSMFMNLIIICLVF